MRRSAIAMDDLSTICERLAQLRREADARDSPISVPIAAAREFNRLVAHAMGAIGHDPRLEPLPADEPDHPRASGVADREFVLVISDALRALGCPDDEDRRE